MLSLCSNSVAGISDFQFSDCRLSESCDSFADAKLRTFCDILQIFSEVFFKFFFVVDLPVNNWTYPLFNVLIFLIADAKVRRIFESCKLFCVN